MPEEVTWKLLKIVKIPLIFKNIKKKKKTYRTFTGCFTYLHIPTQNTRWGCSQQTATSCSRTRLVQTKAKPKIFLAHAPTYSPKITQRNQEQPQQQQQQPHFPPSLCSKKKTRNKTK